MSSFFSSWSPFAKSTSSTDSETIELRHGKNAYHLRFTSEALSSLTVEQLKSLARQEANLPEDVEVKLLYQGRRMDDREKVAKYNVRDGSRILMTSGKKIHVPTSTPSPSPSRSETKSQFQSDSTTSTPNANGGTKTISPQTPLEKISALRKSIKNTYGPQISSFINNPPPTRKEREDIKTRLSELLLQQLLKFDNVDIDPDDFGSNEARLERKAAVKWVQGLMNDIDKVDVNAVQ